MAEKKHRHIGLWAAVIIFSAVSVLFCHTAVSVSRELPRAKEFNRSRLSSKITFSAYERIPQISFPDHLSVCAEQASENIEGIGEVKPVLVNEHFFEVYNIHVGGSAVTRKHIDGKTPALVISDEMSRRLSLDGSAVGQTLSLWGRDFTVVGVYKKPSGFLRGISSDIYNRVYVPYTCREGYGDVLVDSIAAAEGSYSEKALALLGMTESDNEFYIENDLTVKHDIIAVFPNWFVFMLALILSVIVILVLRRMLPPFFRRLRADNQSHYFWAVVRRNLLGILLRLLAAAALIAVPVTLFIKFPIKLVLPLKYIPPDNIFDVGHYISVFTDDVQVANAGLASGNSYYSQLFSNTMIMLLISFAVLTVLAVAIAVRLTGLVKQWDKKRRSDT